MDFNGLKVLIDPKSLIYLKGIVLDFKDGLNGKGFVFDNPNAKNTCGCGESFSLWMINQYRFNVGQFSQIFSQFTLKGNDVWSFLQAQSTIDLRPLSRHHFHLTSFLDPQGRVECYGWLLNSGDYFIFSIRFRNTLKSLMKEV